MANFKKIFLILLLLIVAIIIVSNYFMVERYTSHTQSFVIENLKSEYIPPHISLTSFEASPDSYGIQKMPLIYSWYFSDWEINDKKFKTVYRPNEGMILSIEIDDMKNLNRSIAYNEASKYFNIPEKLHFICENYDCILEFDNKMILVRFIDNGHSPFSIVLFEEVK